MVEETKNEDVEEKVKIKLPDLQTILDDALLIRNATGAISSRARRFQSLEIINTIALVEIAKEIKKLRDTIGLRGEEKKLNRKKKE